MTVTVPYNILEAFKRDRFIKGKGLTYTPFMLLYHNRRLAMTFDNTSGPYWEGYNAYRNNMSRLDNFYNSGTNEWDEWNKGWNDASWDD